MSTIAAVIKGGQIAIAADSQTTTYSRKETAFHVVNHEKIFRVGESFIALSGPASAKLALQSSLASIAETPSFQSIAEIYAVWNDLHLELKEKFFLLPHEDDNEAFESTRMDAIIINSSGLYMVEGHRSVQQFSNYFAIGSGDDYALGAMFVAHQDETKSAEQIARLAVEAAAEWSTETGLPVLSHSIDLTFQPPNRSGADIAIL